MTDLPQEDVQTYLRAPGLKPVAQRVEITLGGALNVSTTDAYRILETHQAPTGKVNQNRSAPAKAHAAAKCDGV